MDVAWEEGEFSQVNIAIGRVPDLSNVIGIVNVRVQKCSHSSNNAFLKALNQNNHLFNESGSDFTLDGANSMTTVR